MSAMAYRMMARFMKFMLKTVLWMTRMFERCLETLDSKDPASFEKPMMGREDKEPVNQANEPRDDADTVDWEEVPAPDPRPTNDPPANDPPLYHEQFSTSERRAAKVTLICPMCTCLMKPQSAGRGGWFYGCTAYPECNGTRSMRDHRPGPVKQVKNLQEMYGPKKWAMIEEQKLNGTFLRWPQPLMRYMDRCRYCGMDPPDHPGRHCPMRRTTGP